MQYQVSNLAVKEKDWKKIFAGMYMRIRESQFFRLQQFAKKLFLQALHLLCVASEKKNKNGNLAKYGEVKKISWKNFWILRKGAKAQKQGTSLVPCFLYLVLESCALFLFKNPCVLFTQL